MNAIKLIEEFEKLKDEKQLPLFFKIDNNNFQGKWEKYIQKNNLPEHENHWTKGQKIKIEVDIFIFNNDICVKGEKNIKNDLVYEYEEEYKKMGKYRFSDFIEQKYNNLVFGKGIFVTIKN